MSDQCLVVLTARGFERIISEGGSQSWRLKPDRAERREFCVCVQNRHNGHWGGADQEHHHAFLIGRIRNCRTFARAARTVFSEVLGIRAHRFRECVARLTEFGPLRHS